MAHTGIYKHILFLRITLINIIFQPHGVEGPEAELFIGLPVKGFLRGLSKTDVAANGYIPVSGIKILHHGTLLEVNI